MFAPQRASSLCLILALAVGLATVDVTAQSIRENSSLKFVPADASFYIAMLRNREQFDDFVKSKAYAKLKQLPFVQMGLAQLHAPPPDSQFGMVKQQIHGFLQSPANQQLLDVLIDAVSHEIFVYGDDGFAELAQTLNRVNGAVNSAQLEAITSGQSPDQVLPRKLFDILLENADNLAVPGFVKGFRLSNPDAATAQLHRLELLANMILGSQPDEIKNRFQRRRLNGGDFLTLNLDGSLVPWDQIPLDEIEENAGVDRSEIEKLVAKAKAMTLSISLGVYDSYLVFAVGESTDALERLGQGEVLANRSELQGLNRHAREPITSMAYVSDSFMKKISSADKQLDDAAGMLKGVLPLAPIDDDIKDQLTEDIDELFGDLKGYIPEPGAVMSYEYRTPEGYESFTYNWATNDMVDASKPLDILDHVGGNPLFFYALRSKYSPDNYDVTVKWFKKAFGYCENLAKAQLGEEELEFFEKAHADLLPLASRWDKANRDFLIPGLKDGQFAIVLDAKSTSTRWHQAMPESDVALPMLELAFVYGVSDSAAVRKGVSELFQVARDALSRLHKMAPDEVPEIQLPPAQSREFPSGSIHYYQVPPMVGLNKRVAPNAGISDRVAVLSVIPTMSKRLLDSNPLQHPGPLADRKRALAGACQFDFAGFLEAIKPWVDYGMKMHGPDGDGGQMIRQHVDVGIEVLQCFRGISSAKYLEGDATVSHTAARFEDIK